MSEIVNKIKQSKLETIDLEKLAADVKVYELDLKDFLFKEMILKEAEFREKMEAHDWSQYEDGYLTVYCSTDAIIPKWAYMLVVQHAKDHTKDVLSGTKREALSQIFRQKMDQTDWQQYEDRFVLLKGCSKMDVPPDVYMYATKKLMPHVKKLMYGEACSNVPIYRKKRS
ncbi:DUF2480 family protein [Rhodohalobacter sulfatireducens]|uniref:DUF2480 family protein n=1 Tax=Rhodohalobacter sulfatireducens TaxID=2911366 RepID=A0ABS9KF21_9BACT|nr:DUF2480 family protein [Rhodohalobacter sulfatireducens]MCG2589439.1 DUF2480 family protein [Rhodohalobacter sulfatireducens]